MQVFLVRVRCVFAAVVPLGTCSRIPPGGGFGAVWFGATLAANRILVLRFGSTLGVVRIRVLKVLRLHVLAGIL